LARSSKLPAKPHLIWPTFSARPSHLRSIKSAAAKHGGTENFFERRPLKLFGLFLIRFLPLTAVPDASLGPAS
jgi:hypothetical protein